MLTARTTELELMQGWFASDPEHARGRVAFPSTSGPARATVRSSTSRSSLRACMTSSDVVP